MRVLGVILGVVFAFCVEAAESLPPVGSVGTEDAVPESSALTGKEIFARVLENRLLASDQRETLSSSDAAGNTQVSALRLRYKDFRDAGEAAGKRVLSKSLLKYTKPRDMKGSGYLVIQNEGRPDDQFVYFPSARKVRRVNLGESILGTDFSMEDILPRELEDSLYKRVADETEKGEACYVIDVFPKADSGSQYSRLRVFVHREHWIPIRTRYWDAAGIEVKEYRANPDEIETIRGIAVPRQSTMRSLLDQTRTERVITKLETEPDLRESMFSIRRLERR